MSTASARRTATAVVVLAWAGATIGCSPGASADEQAAHHRVEIRGMAFVPATLRVSPGDTVTWTSRDIVPHTVTGERAADGAEDTWTSEQLDHGDSFTLVVPERAGSLAYLCAYHPVMKGALEVS